MMLFKKALQTIALVWLLIILTGCGGGGETTVAVGASSSNNSVTLTWDAPTARMDGSILNIHEIGGYKIYYKTSSATNYTLLKDVIGNITTFTAENLLCGTTYHFAVTCYDNSANESGYSTELIKNL